VIPATSTVGASLPLLDVAQMCGGQTKSLARNHKLGAVLFVALCGAAIWVIFPL